MKSITLSPDQYKCLREHLNAIELILGGKVTAGSSASERRASRPEPTRKAKKANYRDLIESGNRGNKPEYLKK
jgi:hypothetical protein